MVKKYIVDLSKEELSYLESVTRKGKHKARTITRAKILIMANEGHLDREHPNFAKIKEVRLFASSYRE